MGIAVHGCLLPWQDFCPDRTASFRTPTPARRPASFRKGFLATARVRTDLRDAALTGSSVHGVAAWDIQVKNGTKQHSLIITADGEPVFTVGNIKVA